MAPQATERFFLETLAPQFGIPRPEYLTAEARGAEIREALQRWGGRALVKPDILAGKRGKAGAVREVRDMAEAQRELKRVQGQEIAGRLPRTAYLVQYIPAETEVYSAVTYDSRCLGPAMTVSLAGGVDVEEAGEDRKVFFPVDVYKCLNAYQAGEMLEQLGCSQAIVRSMAVPLVNVWDMFITTGMRLCEINPWRITPDGKPVACDFKAVFDEANVKFQDAGFALPEYPADLTPFEEEMAEWSAASYRGQAHVAELGGDLVLPILFGGGASTIITETLMQYGGDPIFLSDFGGNPPYERMFGTAKRCFAHHLAKAELILILGGKANNTLIDVTFRAIADALVEYVDEHGPIETPVVIGRGGPHLVQGLVTMKDALESLGLPYVICGPDTPVTQVAEYAARLANAHRTMRQGGKEATQ
jgi:succinyl-CoA synthetase beta subunit